MSDFQIFKEELLKDPEVRMEYEALKPEYEVIAQLMSEMQKGRDSVRSESDWVSEKEMRAHFRI